MDEEAFHVFPLLDGPESYDPNTLDYVKMEEQGLPGRREWLEVFRASIPTYVKKIHGDASLPEVEREAIADQFVDKFNSALEWLSSHDGARIPDLEPEDQEPRVTCVRLW